MARAVAVLLLLVFPGSAWALPLQANGSFRVGLGVGVNLGLSRAWSALLQIEVPLERLAEPPVPARSAPETSPPLEGADAPVPSTRDTERRSARRARAFEVDSRLARAVVREALRVREEPRKEGRLAGLATRSRTASLLPELTLRAARSTDQSLRLTPSGVDRYELTQTGGADLLLEARATWNFDRLVFADEEIRIEQLRADHAESVDRLVSAVLKHLFVWQRAAVHLARAPQDSEDRLELELDRAEAEAVLDVLTDGFFGRVVARSAGTPRSPGAPHGAAGDSRKTE